MIFVHCFLFNITLIGAHCDLPDLPTWIFIQPRSQPRKKGNCELENITL